MPGFNLVLCARDFIGITRVFSWRFGTVVDPESNSHIVLVVSVKPHEVKLIMFALLCLTALLLAVVASRNGCTVTRERGPDGLIHAEWNCSRD